MAPRSKGEIALAELDRVLLTGARFGTVLADGGYGASAAFRHGLDQRGLSWAVGIPCNQKVYGAAVQLVPPAGRARKLVPNEEPRAADEVLAGLPWRRVTWRHGTKGTLAARFAALRIRVGDGPVWGNNRHLRSRPSRWWKLRCRLRWSRLGGCGGKLGWYGVDRRRCKVGHGLGLHVAVLELPLVVGLQQHRADQADD